jgi:uncharacterized protein
MNQSMTTLIVGASPEPTRYAWLAAERLYTNGLPFVAIGTRQGEVLGQPILQLSERPSLVAIDTLTMYMNESNQEVWEDYLLSLRPRRIIFNPGAENGRLEEKARNLGIETANACTLVMIATGQY